MFSTIHSATPLSQRSAPLTFQIIRAFSRPCIIFASSFVIGDLIISLLNVFWHPSAIPGTLNHFQASQVARYLYLLSFVMKLLHHFPYTPASRLRNAIRDVGRTGEAAAEELFQAMDAWLKLVARRWFTFDLPTLAVTLVAVVVWSRT
jgi:hypothetical protein